MSGAEAAYKKLVRLVARAFYSGKLPDSEEDVEITNFGARRAKKWDTRGACVVVLDALSRREWVKEDDLAEKLHIHSKQLRKLLRFLESERIVVREHPREKKAKNGNETMLDPDAGKVRRGHVISYCSIDYCSFMDAIRLKLHLLRQRIVEHLEPKNKIQQYQCKQCKLLYTDFDAIKLLDMTTGRFVCPECKGDVEQLIAGVAASDNVHARKNREYWKGMKQRFEAQLTKVHDLINQLKDVPPPDYGSLTDWARAKRAKQPAGGGRRGGSGGGSRGGGGRAVDGFDNADGDPNINVLLTTTAPQSAAVAQQSSRPAKHVAPWMAQSAVATVAAKTEGVKAEAGGDAVKQEVGNGGAESKPSTDADAAMYSAAYVKAYLASLRQKQQLPSALTSPAAAAVPAAAPVIGEKRKAEDVFEQNGAKEDAAVQEQTGVPPVAEENANATPADMTVGDAVEDEGMWEDVAPALDTAEEQVDADDDDAGWEDI